MQVNTQINLYALLLLTVVAFIIVGCDGDVGTTDDSTRIEVQIPKVDVGNDPIDMDPSTDGDIDMDTSFQGDS